MVQWNSIIKINLIRHAAIRLTTGAFRTSPVPSIIAELPFISTDNIIIVNTALCLASSPQSPTYPALNLFRHTHEFIYFFNYVRKTIASLNLLSSPLKTQPLPAVSSWPSFELDTRFINDKARQEHSYQ